MIPNSVLRQRQANRRAFIGAGARACVSVCVSACGGVLAASALGGCASVLTRTVTPLNGRVELALAQHPELAEPGGSLRIQVAGAADPLYVLSLGDGTFSVLSPICTHLGCTVDIQGARLVCPCHGSTYDREGKVLKGPAERSLTRFPTRISPDAVVMIDLATSAR